MKSKKQTNGNNKKTSSKGKQPDYRVAVAKEVEGQDKPFWTTIGSAWEAKRGISIQLNALPLTDHMMLFINEEDEGNEEQEDD